MGVLVESQSRAEKPKAEVLRVDAFSALSQLDGAEAKGEKLTKNAKKKLKKKERKKTKADQPQSNGATTPTGGDDDDVEIEYVADAMVPTDDPNYQEWIKIFEKFQKGKEVSLRP
mmetsp:Transcript_14600/g.22660  ORF Transcript_14600/g.22660 Transcript_14600/m.22660 type:complete len:115 (-) Transcript_14600:1881-2225(-)